VLNTYTLDYASLKQDDEWGVSRPAFAIMEELINKQTIKDIELKYIFTVKNYASFNSCFLAVEKVDSLRIEVNHHELVYDETKYWLDKQITYIDILSYLKNGENEVILKLPFKQSQSVYDTLFGDEVLETLINKLTYDTEIESIYLIGDFGVYSTTGYIKRENDVLTTTGSFYLDKLDRKNIKNDCLVESGLPYFAGRISFSKYLNVPQGKYLFDVDYKCMAVNIYVNEELIKTLMWDNTCYLDLKEGDNKIVIEVVTSNRNLLGPHHHVKGELKILCPNSFTDKGGWADGMVDIWDERYSFVEYGIQSIKINKTK